MRNSFSSQLARTIFVYLAILLVTLCAIYPLSNVAGSQPEPAAQSANSFLRWLGESSLVALAVAVAGLTLASAIGYTVADGSGLFTRGP